MSTTPSQFEPAGAGSAGGLIVDEPLVDPSAPAQVKARGYWEQVWIRFKRDKVALGSIVFIVLLVISAFPGAWIASTLLGHGPDTGTSFCASSTAGASRWRWRCSRRSAR